MRKQFSRHLLLVSVAAVVTGCAGGQSKLRVAAAPPPLAKLVKAKPTVLIAQANDALAAGNGPAAITFAELAARAMPDDVAVRGLLARAYLAAGRVRAAADAYGDLLAHDPSDVRARLGRALARLADGDKAGALADLDQLPAGGADAGLAYALAGDSARGVELLTAAARSDTATARIRQNLALALALDGQFAKARAVAGQDLDAVSVDRRFREWTALAANGDYAGRAATMLAITRAASDPGRPVALAWATPDATNALAAAEPIPQPLAEPEPAPVEVSAVDPAPAVLAVALPDTPPAPTPFAAPSGRWVVQLGAYTSPQTLDANWRLLSRDGKLAGYAPVSTPVMVADRTLHRLSVGGFISRWGANQLCIALKRSGRDCIVRDAGQVAPTQLALRLG